MSLQVRPALPARNFTRTISFVLCAHMTKRDERQLKLPLMPKLRVIDGLGQRKPEPLASRDDVARVLIGAGADLLLRRISSERAEELEAHVEEILRLFDRVDRQPILMPVLAKKLDALEGLVRESREKRLKRRK